MNTRKVTTLLIGVTILAGALHGQFPGSKPSVGDVLNAASYAEPEASNGAIAPGSMFVVKGYGLGPSRLQVIRDFPLETSLAGTSVQVTIKEGVREKTWDALMIYTSTSQIAAILPSDVPRGRGRLTVAYEGKKSDPEPIWIVHSSPGIFTRNQGGSGPGIIQNYVSETELPLNALTQPARPGQVEILWGTGLGAAVGDETAGPVPGDMAVPVELMVGGKSAKVLYKGRSGCCAGIDQVVFELPEGVEGCYVPVVVRADGVFSNFVTMSIASSGEVCPDLPGLNEVALDKLQRGENVSIGRVELMRITSRVELPGLTGVANTDIAYSHFTRYPAPRLAASQSVTSAMTGGVPSPGYCSIVRRNDIDVELGFPVIYDDVFSGAPNSSRLDAGKSLSLTGPQGDRSLSKTNYRYFGFLGGSWPDPWQATPEYLEPGLYTVTNGDGGNEIGPFQATLELPHPTVWTNRDAIAEVDRRQDLTVTWTTPRAEDHVVVVFASAWANNQEYFPMAVLCAERATAGRLTVPSWILSQLPASGSYEGIPFGTLGVITTETADAAAPLPASGVDDGRFTYSLAEMKLMAYR